MSNCKHCKQELVSIPWNMNGNIMVCDNWKCQLYRTPQGFEYHGNITMDNITGHGRRMVYDNSFSLFLPRPIGGHSPAVDGYEG